MSIQKKRCTPKMSFVNYVGIVWADQGVRWRTKISTQGHDLTTNCADLRGSNAKRSGGISFCFWHFGQLG